MISYIETEIESSILRQHFEMVPNWTERYIQKLSGIRKETTVRMDLKTYLFSKWWKADLKK